MMYYLCNIHLKGNEHGQLKRDTIYAELRHKDGSLAISATLEHILASIRDRGLLVEGVSVEYFGERGVKCSTVKIIRHDVRSE